MVRSAGSLLLRLLLLSLCACDGTVVAGPDDGSGAAGSTGTGGSTSTSGSASTSSGTASTGTTSTVTTTGSGGGPCDNHEDCPGGLCVFAMGTCAPACGDDLCGTCGPGAICDECATSSCPECKDCLPACAPITEPGRCDGNDPCQPGEVCIFSARYCAPLCGVNDVCGPGQLCQGCVTGSCCGCEDCVSACVGGE